MYGCVIKQGVMIFFMKNNIMKDIICILYTKQLVTFTVNTIL